MTLRQMLLRVSRRGKRHNPLMASAITVAGMITSVKTAQFL
jgi:hypothetical protein